VTFKEGAFYYRYKFPGAPRFTPLEEEALRWGREGEGRVTGRGERERERYRCAAEAQQNTPGAVGH
jgi:hypothetical protein